MDGNPCVRRRSRVVRHDDSRRVRAAAARRADVRVDRRVAGADRGRLRAGPRAVQPPFTVESRLVSDHDFLFTLRVPENGQLDAMLNELTASVLRHVGYAAGDIAELGGQIRAGIRSEEHTSELQSQSNLVCRLLLEK